MDKIQIANILLTRRCNLKCSYCNIIKEYKTKPDEYKKISYYNKNELSYKEWMKIFSALKNNNPDVFFILYGGEPFLYNDLELLLQEMHNNDMKYTIITNNTDFVQERLHSIAKKIGGYKGLTSSVDPIIFSEEDNDSDRMKKSKLGLERLTQMRHDGIGHDVVAEITCDSTNIQYLYDTVKELSNRSIWSSITVIDRQKHMFYDFSSVDDETMLLLKNKIVLDQFQKIINDKTLLVHIPDLLMELYNVLPCDMFCRIYTDIHNVTIEPDGHFRLCLRIAGTNTIKYDRTELISDDGKVLQKLKNALYDDYISYCSGCNWTCMFFSKLFANQIINH